MILLKVQRFYINRTVAVHERRERLIEGSVVTECK